MTDDLVEDDVVTQTNAWCPYCDRLRGHNHHGIMVTCGANECFRAAMRDAQKAGHPPRATREIDFANGFASQNLTFAADRARLRIL